MNKRFVFVILGILFCLNVLAWLAVFELSQSRFLEVIFFDVGQGDSIFIETPQRHQILIDGGPGSIILEKLAEEMPFWDRTIDLVILTHPEHDHMAGLIEVLKSYEVENILWTGVLRKTAEFEQWQKLIKEEGANIYTAKAGQLIEGNRISLNILWPQESLEDKEISNTNNSSVAVKLSFGENSFLFTGDIYKEIEGELLGQAEQLDVDVLKVSHHGSKTSSNETFIEKASPRIAVIQCGKDNSYGHPHAETLEVLEKYGIDILRTDLKGNIKITSDGQDLILAN